MLRVLIVDDEMLARDELKYLLTRTKEVDIIDEAENIEEALDKMVDYKPDLLFLDIQLSEDNGIDFAKRLKKMKNPPSIVFATAYDQYALQAFEVDAIDYILKPFDEERILNTINKYKKLKQHGQDSNEEKRSTDITSVMNKLALSIEESIVLVNIGDIIYAGLEDGKVVVKTIKQTFIVNDPLVILEKKLPQDYFIRVHRSYIVNSNHILEVQPWFNSTYNITTKDGSKIPVSRTYVKEFKRLLGI